MFRDPFDVVRIGQPLRFFPAAAPNPGSSRASALRMAVPCTFAYFSTERVSAWPIIAASPMLVVKFDEIKGLAGKKIGVSEWYEITQDKVNLFADATGDHQWIHVDVERAAKELPTGGTIAHGYLTLSLIPMLSSQILRIEGVTRGINYGCNKVRFINMVPVGSRVRGRQKLLAVQDRAGGLQLINEFTIEIEGHDQPACVAQTISLVYN